jgi:hypothetical protein
MDREERRYDVLPPWAWRRPEDDSARAARRIATMERQIRESDRAFAEDLAALSRLMARHRMNAHAYRARLARLKREGAAT